MVGLPNDTVRHPEANAEGSACGLVYLWQFMVVSHPLPPHMQILHYRSPKESFGQNDLRLFCFSVGNNWVTPLRNSARSSARLCPKDSYGARNCS